MSKPAREKNVSIPLEILAKLLTPSEIRMLKNRFLIMNSMDAGLTIRTIAEKVGVGTDTVMRTIRLVDEAGLRNKNKKSKKFKTSTPWIFGKSDE